MKAAVYYETGDPSVLRYETLPDPVCHPAGVIIEVKAIGIQGGDTLHRQGGVLASVPHVVGYQAAGIIREVGERVTDREPGQAVVATMNFGSHASMVSVPAAATYPLPDGMDPKVAACVPIEFATADDCLFEFGHLKRGERVLVQAGASGVGIAAIQLAKQAGATVLATASSDEKLERLKSIGLDHGINYVRENFVARVMHLTNGHGADLVVDSVGGKTLEGSIAALAYRGRVSWVGRAGRDAVNPEIWPLMQKNASITGVFLGAEMQLHPERCGAMIERLLADVARGALHVAIDRVFPLADAAEAHRYAESRQAFGRIVMVP